jgi:subtilisin family serine protease
MERSEGESGLVIGLIDGPVAVNHPDLTAVNLRKLPNGADAACINPVSMACTHGTSVAGILVAKRDSIVTGICPNCTLLVRSIFSEDANVLDDDGMPHATVVELATALREVIEGGARVVNLSVGLADHLTRAEPALDLALNLAARREVIVVAAAGNQGTLGSSPVTQHRWVIPVVGCARDGRILERSNLSASIGRRGVAAPGHDIVSLAAQGGYATFSGSSAAVPFVSGTIALLWSVFPRSTAAQLRSAIVGSAARRRSVTPPLLSAAAAAAALGSTQVGG